MNLKGTYKNKKEQCIKQFYWTKKCHDCQVKRNMRNQKPIPNHNRLRKPSKNQNASQKWGKWAQEIYAQRSKTVEWPFGHLKRNIKMIEFNYTGVEMVNTEMKLHAIGHNLKRLYNELNKTTKNQENT